MADILYLSLIHISRKEFLCLHHMPEHLGQGVCLHHQLTLGVCHCRPPPEYDCPYAVYYTTIGRPFQGQSAFFAGKRREEAGRESDKFVQRSPCPKKIRGFSLYRAAFLGIIVEKQESVGFPGQDRRLLQAQKEERPPYIPVAQKSGCVSGRSHSKGEFHCNCKRLRNAGRFSST